MENTGKTIYEYIAKNIDIEYESSGLKHLDHTYKSRFHNSFYSLFSVIEKGYIESILKIKNDDIKIKRDKMIACYIPREVYAKTMLLHSSEADILWSRMNFNIFGNIDLLSFFDIPFIFDLESSTKIQSVNQELYNLELAGNNESIRSIVQRRKLCFQMLDLILTISPLKKDVHPKLIIIEEFLPVIDYINKNYKQKISNASLKKLTSLSLSRFCHKFKLVMSISPQQYIQQKRFIEISKLLANTNLRINEIAHDYGFSDQFHFSRAFKSATGYSPKKYRNLLKNNKEGLFSS